MTERKEFDSRALFSVLKKYKKSIGYVLLLTLIVSILVSSPLFIDPLYKSTVILYPTSTNSISKILLNTNIQTDKDLLEFGETEQTEQMLQVLNSNKIRDRVIEQFDLMNHYGVKENSKYRYTNLYKQYENKIKFRRTEYTAVKITVMDKDPLLAAEIANEIAELFDSTMNQMQKQVARKAFDIVEKEYLNLSAYISQMEDSLNELRQLGIYDYETQAEMYTQQLAIQLARGNKSAIKAIEEKLELLGKYGGGYLSLKQTLEYELLQLTLLRAKYEEAKVDATQDIPQKFIVTSAYPAEKKSYPIRWLIVAISLASTFLLLFFVLIMVEKYGITKKKNSSHRGGNVK
ncbi:MAG: hypothetical protein LBM67_06665 [Lentimicrobiaceae bacterium]|jgi:uncharacterized protein involved in exopolysaccharide biosynthesis|nr:hypothetical protein [Lentimicrobiaceae bacterium]